MNLYIPQLQFTVAVSMQTIERENRQNGNEEDSQEGTRKEGRKEGRKEEVVAETSNQNRQHSEGDASKHPPQCLWAQALLRVRFF